MATFSFGVAPGAPGTYINEVAGNAATAGISSFSTVYMLVETEESVSVTKFPFNKPMMVTSLADYKAIAGGAVPESRIPLLSYNCVNAFFQNSQVGDLRVVRVGTPNQIVEIEILASGNKINNSAIPSPLEAGDVVYAQVLLNELKLVAGDGSTGYSSEGEWLGVPVTIPVDYIAGDAVNNRKISKAIATAIAAAIESNPSVRNAIYVRDFGLVVDTDPTSNSENAFVTIAASTYGGNVSVVTQQVPVGSINVLMNNAYDVQNIVGLQNDLVRLPQDYIQCISTAFDGQQDQGYLITPTAYAQFDAAGRAAIGAAAAAHCQSNDFKWMALADPGPFLVTDLNKYSNYSPHLPASDLITGMKYLVDNSIYEWTGVDVSYDKLPFQAIIGGYDPKVAVQQSVEAVASDEKVGLIDPATFTLVSASPNAEDGKFTISSSSVWPAGMEIMEVNLSNKGDDFSGFPDQVYIVAPPYDTAEYGPYPSNGTVQVVYIALSATAASNVYTEVSTQGGSSLMTGCPADAESIPAPTGSTVDASYGSPAWDLGSQVEINGQSSNLVQNVTNSAQYVNTTHIPGTLQDSTKDYRLGFVSRTFFNPQSAISSTTIGSGSYCLFTCDNHKLTNGQQVFFTHKIEYNSSVVFKATNVNGTNPYYVKVISPNSFVLAASYSGYLAASYVTYPGTISTTTPTILYSKVAGGGLTALNLGELATIPMIRGRKYGLASGSIADTAYDADEGMALTPPNVSIYLNNSSVVLGSEQIFPYGEDENAGWHPKLELETYGSSNTNVANYICSPTVGQRFGTEAYLVPSIDAIYGGEYDPSATNTVGPLVSVTNLGTGTVTKPVGTYTNVSVTGGSGSGAKATVAVTLVGGFNKVTAVTITDGGVNYDVTDTGLGLDGTGYTGFTMDAAAVANIGHLDSVTNLDVTPVAQAAGTYTNVSVTGGLGTGAKATVVVNGSNVVTSVTITDGGTGYDVTDTGLGLSGAGYTGFTMDVSAVDTGEVSLVSDYVGAFGLSNGVGGNAIQDLLSMLSGVYFDVTANGVTPDNSAAVVSGDRIAVVYNGSTYSWVVVPADSEGGDLSSVALVCYGSQVEISLTPEQTPPSSLWRFDAITSIEIMDNALRGVGFNGDPQAVFIEAGVDNVNRLYEDSQRYFNAYGFIAYYGPYIQNTSGQFIPPSPYVTGVAIRRYRAEGFQFPPAGVKYQLADAASVQIPVNSAQQNLLNPDGCNVVRTLPGYPDSAIFIWGGRTRVNGNVAEQRKFQFVNTRVIQNIVYGSLRSAFDNQIFAVIDGFGVIFNQIVTIGNSVLGQLWTTGALFGARPSDAFQVICDNRINTPENLENGLVYVKVFDVPVPTLERIEVDLIRVSIGQMSTELESQNLS